MVFYSVLGSSFWALFSENCPSLPQSSDSHLNAESFDLTRRQRPSCLGPRSSAYPLANDRTAWTVQALYLVRLSRWDRVITILKPLEAATSTCFRLTILALTPTDIHIRHRHRNCHRGGMSKTTLPPTELQIPATVTTIKSSRPWERYR